MAKKDDEYDDPNKPDINKPIPVGSLAVPLPKKEYESVPWKIPPREAALKRLARKRAKEPKYM